MKPSLQKLQKFFKLETERGYDNRAVLGGLDRILDHWEAEARADDLPESFIQEVMTRVRAYPHLATESRAETLEHLLQLIQQSLSQFPPEQSTWQFEGEESPHPERLGESTSTLYVEKQVGEMHTAVPPPPSVRMKPEITPRVSSTPGEPVALNAPVTVLPGVGQRYAYTLSRLEIHTLRDMLYHFPRRYNDFTQLKPIHRLKYGEEVTVIGTVQKISTRSFRGGELQMVEAIISDGSGSIRASWFNQVWIAKRLHVNDQISLSGRVDQYLGRFVINNPEWEHLEQQQLNTNRIVPVYPSTAQVTQRWLRRLMNQVVTYWAPRLQDYLPEALRKSADIIDLPTALLQVHFPDTWEDLKKAQDRLAFDEIFFLQLGVLRQKRAWQERTARRFPIDPGWLDEQIARLPFSLTGAQQRALQDICQDLASGHPMNRLLQGDVGSGKTVIAALAIAMVANHGAQSAVMTPTSILAEQHYKNIQKILAHADSGEQNSAPGLHKEQIRLMIGATPEATKRQIRAGLADGSIKVVIGTHALLEDPVTFADLQLVIIDEQHRFGVEHRATLRAKGENPHLLVMTATPIPRSLALTIYGDLDLSILDEMPPGRQPVSTHVLTPRERERAYSLIRTRVKQGQQAFIIYPLVEENAQSEGKAAVEEHVRLQKEIFPEFKLGLLHGRMPQDEKESVMARFRDGELHILVSTSVIEVGVDVPNATAMLIEGANRFGLAQLHQFRGRIGRGPEKSYCLLIPDTLDEMENERLQVMVETTDGFILAEYDLKQRGPGEFLGTRQSGYSKFQLANITNIHLIDKARRHAQMVFEDDPELIKPEHQLLAAALRQSWRGGKGDIS